MLAFGADVFGDNVVILAERAVLRGIISIFLGKLFRVMELCYSSELCCRLVV